MPRRWWVSISLQTAIVQPTFFLIMSIDSKNARAYKNGNRDSYLYGQMPFRHFFFCNSTSVQKRASSRSSHVASQESREPSLLRKRSSSSRRRSAYSGTCISSVGYRGGRDL